MTTTNNNNNIITPVNQPNNLNINLYEHQLLNIHRMEILENKKQILKKYDGHNRTTVRETNFGVLADPRGTGKCMAKGTELIMFNGDIKKIEDIQVGEQLMGDDSKPRNVLSLANGKEIMYKIKQKYGDDYIVNESHILSLKLNPEKQIFKSEYEIIVFYLDNNSFSKFESKIGNKFFKIKSFKILEDHSNYNEINENVNKFINSYDNIVDISIIEYNELPNEIKELLVGYKATIDFNKDIQLEIKPGITAKYFASILKTSPIITPFNKETLSTRQLIKLSKRNLTLKNGIPKEYLFTTRSNRRWFLKKLVENKFFLKIKGEEGWYREEDNNNIKLISDIKFLIQSCGYLVEIKYNSNHCIIKAIIGKLHLTTPISITKLIEDDYYGFTLDGNHRYILKDFTVTHNTLTTIGLIVRDKMEWDIRNSYTQIKTKQEIPGILTKRYIENFKKLQCTLILVAPEIISQWEYELSYTNLKYNKILNTRDTEKIKARHNDVLLVVPKLFNELLKRYRFFAWKRFIFDDPCYIRIPNMKSIKAGFYWLISSKPNLIPSKHLAGRGTNFIKDLVSNIMFNFEDEYGDMIIRNDSIITTELFQSINVNKINYNCKTIFNSNEFIAKINSLLDINYSSNKIIIELGGNVTFNIFEYLKNKQNKELEQIQSKISRSSLSLRRKNYKLKERISNQNINKFENLNEEICNICLDTINKPVLELNCMNCFCSKCLIKWFQTKVICPLCRSDIHPEHLVYITDNKSDYDYIIKNQPKKILSKLDKMINIISDNNQGNILIYSSNKETFNPIREKLFDNNIIYHEFIGERKIDQINKYLNSDIPSILFLNTENILPGLNLHCITDIIFYHPIKNIRSYKESECDIIGRCVQFKTESSINIHYLTTTE